MNKLEEKIAFYIQKAKELNLDLSEDLITKVTKGLGPSIYKKDAEIVSCADKSELDRVRENFLKKKLSLSNSDEELDAALKEICEKMGSSNKNKYRAIFYSLLVQKFNKEDIYS